MNSAWHWVSIGTADLEAALAFWVGKLGFEEIGIAEGDDIGLRVHWRLSDQRVARQAMVRAPGAAFGAIHLVEWRSGTKSVRADASVFDLCPKNLDIYVDDLPRRMAQLAEQGVIFRNKHYGEAVSPDGVHFREIHLAGHDDINLVLLQILGSETAIPATGFYGIGPLVCIVQDPASEKRFCQQVLGLALSHDNILAGPEIEQMIGLPEGCALEVSIWAQPGQPLGEVELVTYHGVAGVDQYPRASPGRRGVTHLNWWVEDIETFSLHLASHGVRASSSHIEGRLIQTKATRTFRSPAGLQIEVHTAI